MIALTGASGRIPRAIDVLRAGGARKLLVAGVASEFARSKQLSTVALKRSIEAAFLSDNESQARRQRARLLAHTRWQNAWGHRHRQ